MDADSVSAEILFIANALSPMSVTESGITTVCSEFRAKAYEPMLVTESGIETESSPMPAKARSAIDETM
jgi:hypothetical protein